MEVVCENSKIWGNLESVSTLPLCILIIINRKGTGQSGQHQKCSSWWGLGWGAKSWEGLVWESPNKKAQSGYDIKIVNFDH